MRLPFGLISTFLLFSSLSFLPSVFATRRRHSKDPKDAIIASRQWRPQPVARALLDVCVNLNVVLPPGLKQLLTGNIDLCLCLKDLDIFLDAKVKDLGVLGGLLDVPFLRILLNDLLRQSGKDCSLPDHAHFVCTNSDPCHFDCDEGFTRVGDQCVCAPPKKLCQGQCVSSPNACDPSAVPRSLRSRRNEITTLKQAQKYCGGKSVCGLPSGQGFECVDTESAVDSCGGCVYPNPWATATSGRDCATPHALKAACRQSQCVVDLCQDGFAPNDARDACVAIHRKRLVPASHKLLRLESLDHPEFGASDLNARRSSLCPPPSPTIPASSPTTQGGLLDLIVDLSTLGKNIGSLGGLLSDKCNCHDSPSHPSPHDPAPMLKSVVTLSLKVDAKLGDLSKDPANIESIVILLGQLLNASDKCLALPEVEDDIKGIIVQLKDAVGVLLKGLHLLPSGVKQCGCEEALHVQISTRETLVLLSTPEDSSMASSAASDSEVFSLLSPTRPAAFPLPPGPSDGSCGPCTGPDGQPDPTAPVDVDLTCLLGLGIDGDVVADLGPGLDKPLNELLHSLFGDGVHPSNVIHPCLKCSGSGGSGSTPTKPSSDPSKTTPASGSTPVVPSSKPSGSPGGDSGSSGPCTDANGQPDNTAPVDVDLTCLLGVPGIDGDVVANLGPGLNMPLNQLLHNLLGDGVHPSNIIHPCLKCSGGNGGSGSSTPTRGPSQASTTTGNPTTPSSTPSGDSSGSPGPCKGSDGQPDLTAPVDVDLTCLLGLGIDGDVVADLGPGLNKPLNELLHSLFGDGVHPSNVIHPCLKCTGGNGGGGDSGSGSGTGSGSEATKTTSDCTSSPSSPAGHTTPTGVSVSTPPPPSRPTGSTGGSSGSGASSNTAIPTSSAPTPHSSTSVVVTTRSSAPSSSPTVGTGTGVPQDRALAILIPLSGHLNAITGPCLDSNGKPDPTAPVDVDLTCLLGIPGIDGDVVANLEPGLNMPLNQLLHQSPRRCGGGGSGSSTPTRDPSQGSTAGNPTTPSSTPSGGSGSPGPCKGSNGQPDPTAPVDVDITCLLGIPGIDGDVVANLGSLNVPLNQLLHQLLGDGVHPSNIIHPCLKCSGGGGSGSGSGPSTTSPTGSSPTSGCSEDGAPATATPVIPPNTDGPKSGNGTPCQKCGQGSGDSTNAVVVDLNPIGIDAVVTVDVGPSLNKLLNGLLDPLLKPIVHAAPSRRSGSGPLPVDDLKADLKAAVNFGTAISRTAKTLFSSCGCTSEPNSPVLLTVAVSAKLKTSIDDLQKNPTVKTATAALDAAKAVLGAAQSCEALPGLGAQVIALIRSLEKDCQGLIPKLESLVSGLQTCGCGKELRL
ncbi:hypothetical protein AAF712_008496 [Marasmius tenuissimus]|uniref:Protein CPL1-like domain-containing protein n=1 Tax=Marasmius tenuissimus TaxID=585030 RepID=A0ABR2ZS99_9AGAR